MDTNSELSAKGAKLLGIMWAIVACGMGCHSDHDNSEAMVAPALASDWTPFVEMARQSPCIGIRNRLFVVDHVLVFWDRQGNCPDYGYGETLYGQTVNDLLCEFHDSIAGPVKDCPVPSYQEMFEIMIGHLDAPDLGLGPGHTVEQIPF